MATASKLQQDVPAPLKSVWKKFTETNSSTTTSQNLVNGNSTADEAHERDSVSSKDIAHGEGSSQGHSTPASSMTDEAATINSPPRPPAPIPVYRPAPLPQVNPWKVRQEEIERKRWKESQETPPVPIQIDRVVPKPSTNAFSKSGNKLNGVVKSDVKAPSRRSTKNNNPVPPPALEDSEAWPSPDVAASVEKEDRVKQTSATPTIKDTPKEAVKSTPTSKESPSESAKVSMTDAAPKEVSNESSKDSAKDGWREVTKESKKKKWEKIEVNFQYDSPQNRRGRGGGKFNRNARGGTRDSLARAKDGINDRPEKGDKSRNAPRSDGEETAVPVSAAPVERRAQSFNFDSGHRQHDVLAPEWSMRPPYTQEPVPVSQENWPRGPALPPPQPEQPEHQTQVAPDVDTQRSRSPASSAGKDSSSPSASKHETMEQQHHEQRHEQHRELHNSPPSSPNGQTQFSEMPSQWDEQEHNLAYQNNLPYSQQGNQARRGNSRSNYNRTRNGHSPNGYQPQPNQYVAATPQQLPFQGFYPPMYSPMQPGFPPNTRAHSLPYYPPNSMSRYPQPAYPPAQWFPDYSRLGVQPVPVIDDDVKARIVRQIDYYFSSENLFKDVFLRKKMDSQGFVPIAALVQFHRLQVITSDVPTVLNALLSSTEVEVLSNSERGPLVRARHDPTKWAYPMNERDETAKHPGPSAYYFQAHQDSLRQMQDNYQYSYPQPYYFDAQYGFPTATYRPHEELVPPILNEPELHSSSVSPHYDPQNRKLSGEASVFVPNGAQYSPMMNGDGGAFDAHSMRSAIPTVTEEHDEPVEALDDDNLSNLVVIVTDPKDKPVIPALPMNGVKHEQEPHRSPPPPVTWRFSDITAATQASTSVSIKSGLSSLTAQDDVPSRGGTGETALTEKNLKKQLSQSGITESSYSEFRSKAIQSRQKSNPDSTQMIYLYQFWSDFLSDYWVPGMYAEFVHYAVEDANANRRIGLLKLFSLYERVLEVKFQALLWNDFVRLAGEDYRNGHLAGIESVWQIRGHISARGKNVIIQDGDVSRLVEGEIKHPADFDRLRKEVKPAGLVLVPYTIRQGT